MTIIMRIFSYFLILSLLTVSCCKDEIPLVQTDENGVIITQSYQWKSSLHAGNIFHSNGHFDYPIMYNQNIAIPTTGIDGDQYITMINSSDGKAQWTWNDPDCSFYISYFYHYNNLLTWQSSNTSYCVNMENGSTFWKIKRNFYVNSHHFNSILDKYVTYGFTTRTDGYDEEIALTGDVQSGELTSFLNANLSCEFVAPVTENGLVGGISYVNELPNSNCLLVTYGEPLPEWKNRMMFGLYNTQTQEWVYERKLLVTPHWNAGVQHTPIIFNNRVYAAAGNYLICHDVETGDQLWSKEFDQDFLFSGFIIEDDKIIANNEDLILYCLDPETGSNIWTGEGAGTSSRMSYLNGIVYFVGGSDSKFHAVDIETGQTVWRLDAEKLEGYDGKFKTNAVYVIPGESGKKGKVIALTHMNAYCFEAYR